jgi:hypothetical protein
MAGPTGVITYNHDVAGLQRRINRFIYEMIKSVSNAGSLMNEYDKNRLSTYLTAIRAYVGWVVSQPQLDLPETSPRAITLDPNPTWELMENEAIIDVIRMLEIARDELVNSQASRASSGLNKFDEARILALVTKVEDFLTKYINVITPLDLPESTPMRAMTGAGQTGV